ncbi:tripartite motif-containing protein 5 isoform X1 [Syngnathoides biaculeatus]|uniref:tripartite motif-containing protein 5 isoform X1 n=1 Tax=Syngnathoides biaculeatus TaxID=300417 RepID=UPI002ADE7CCD|nr:tripartite motif-containing protein 5 isoform X1 [Syngnathoides biaculeatus]
MSLPEEDLTCPVCHEIFSDPVVLSCSHSFCRRCQERCWDSGLRECPVCRKKSSKSARFPNLALKNICEAVVQARRDTEAAEDRLMCPLHGERFKLFCLRDKEPICVVCRCSKAHKDHQCSPVEEATADCKGKLSEALESLGDKLDKLKTVHESSGDMLKHIKDQSAETQRLIRVQFEQLRQTLGREEEARLAAVKKEEEEKMAALDDKMKQMAAEALSLTESVEAVRRLLGEDDVDLLKKFKDQEKRNAGGGRHARRPHRRGRASLQPQVQSLGENAGRSRLHPRDLGPQHGAPLPFPVRRPDFLPLQRPDEQLPRQPGALPPERRGGGRRRAGPGEPPLGGADRTEPGLAPGRGLVDHPQERRSQRQARERLLDSVLQGRRRQGHDLAAHAAGGVQNAGASPSARGLRQRRRDVPGRRRRLADSRVRARLCGNAAAVLLHAEQPSVENPAGAGPRHLGEAVNATSTSRILFHDIWIFYNLVYCSVSCCNVLSFTFSRGKKLILRTGQPCGASRSYADTLKAHPLFG